jgi:hypothetical protein
MNERRNLSLRKYSNNSKQLFPKDRYDGSGVPGGIRRLSTKRLNSSCDKKHWGPKQENNNIVLTSGTGTVSEGITHLRNIKNIVMNSSLCHQAPNNSSKYFKKRSTGALLSRSSDRQKRLGLN